MAYSSHYDIHYSYPKFHRRVFANLIDFLLFAFLFFALFLGSRAAVTNMPGYVEKDNALLAIRSDSGLYRVDGKKTTDIVSYLGDESNNYTAYQKMMLSSQTIDHFIAYVGEKTSLEEANKIQSDYDAYRLDTNLTYEGVAYFIKSETGEIVRNKTCKANNETYFSSAYAPYIDKQCQGYLVTLIPEYLEILKFEAYMLFFLEIPIAFLLAGVLIYLIPPIFFKKGRMTLGKAMYQIALVDSRLLSCTFPRYLARWAIFFIGELCLSLFTFGIPCIISFSLMAFSKGKQGFPDYLLGLFEVDISHDKIYSSYEEISLDDVDGEKNPIDFRATYED